MDLAASTNTELTLEQIREQFEHWRRTRGKRRSIPDALWEAAVSLFREHSLCQVSKALRLNYTDLKRRVQAQQTTVASPTVNSPAFIELGMSDTMRPAGCIVEMEDQKGSKMRMYFKGDAGLDLLELGKAFWSKRS
jgi:hypothetical protein